MMDERKAAENGKVEIPSYKRLQRELEAKLRSVWILKDDNKKPGTIFTSMIGRKYQVQADGSWRRV